MKCFFVEDCVKPLFLVPDRKASSRYGIRLGAGVGECFVAASDELMSLVPEECWDFRHNHVYVEPLSVQMEAGKAPLLVPEPIDSSTQTQALVLVRQSVSGVDDVLVDLPPDRIVARAGYRCEQDLVSEVLVILNPSQSMRLVGLRHGTQRKEVIVSFDSSHVQHRIVHGLELPCPRNAA